MNIEELIDTSAFFAEYYRKARANSIIVIDANGFILHVNESFTKNFGYAAGDITKRHFSKLFTTQDNEMGKPAIELNTVLSTGQSYDDNYVVNKSGQYLWCTGESILVKTADGQKYIVKDIINLEERKAFLGFVRETETLLDKIFLSQSEIAMIVLDGTLKVIKANTAFMHLFGLTTPITSHSRLSAIKHPFWSSAEIKQELSNMLVRHEALNHRRFVVSEFPEDRTIFIDSHILEGAAFEKKIYLIIEK